MYRVHLPQQAQRQVLQHLQHPHPAQCATRLAGGMMPLALKAPQCHPVWVFSDQPHPIRGAGISVSDGRARVLPLGQTDAPLRERASSLYKQHTWEGVCRGFLEQAGAVLIPLWAAVGADSILNARKISAR